MSERRSLGAGEVTGKSPMFARLCTMRCEMLGEQTLIYAWLVLRVLKLLSVGHWEISVYGEKF